MEEAVQFIDWDYDALVATEYERIGECNRCGDCCRRTINIRRCDGEGDPRLMGGTTTDGEGRWSEVVGGEERLYIKFSMPYEGQYEDENHTCSSLTEDNLCSANGEKAWVCEVWPTAPSDIEKFPRCSYSFKEVNRWEFTVNREVAHDDVQL